jgi:hypothetical protein
MSFLHDFFKSGKKLIDDTKTPAVPKAKKKGIVTEVSTETDPHKILVRRTIQEKPKKIDLVEDFKRFIKTAEASS